MTQTVNKRLEVSLGKLRLRNPIMPASGCFAFGREYAQFYDLNVLGAIAVKATTVEERMGNATPRVAETSSGMLNSIGLQNPGLDKVISEELAFLEQYDVPALVNVAGKSIDDYVQVSSELSKAKHLKNLQALEINVSCPNVQNGIQFGSNPDSLYELTSAVKKVSSLPVFVKLSPNVTDIVAMAKAAESAGADGLSMINTLLGMRIDIAKQKPILARGSGGLSGPAIKPVAIHMIYQVSQQVKIPIIGMGGIMNAEDVIEFILAGASAVAVGTANFSNPMICPEIINELDQYLDRAGVENISELVGRAWR